MHDPIHQAGPAHQGITLALAQNQRRVEATIVLARSNRKSTLFEGLLSVADSLRKAKQLSSDHGFKGFFEITQPDEWATPDDVDLEGAITEITHQIGALRPNLGFSWGFSIPPMSSRGWASMDPARAQLTRLTLLRDALIAVRAGIRQVRATE